MGRKNLLKWRWKDTANVKNKLAEDLVMETPFRSTEGFGQLKGELSF